MTRIDIARGGKRAMQWYGIAAGPDDARTAALSAFGAALAALSYGIGCPGVPLPDRVEADLVASQDVDLEGYGETWYIARSLYESLCERASGLQPDLPEGFRRRIATLALRADVQSLLRADPADPIFCKSEALPILSSEASVGTISGAWDQCHARASLRRWSNSREPAPGGLMDRDLSQACITAALAEFGRGRDWVTGEQEPTPRSVTLLKGMAAAALRDPHAVREPIVTAMTMIGATNLAATLQRSCQGNLTASGRNPALDAQAESPL